MRPRTKERNTGNPLIDAFLKGCLRGDKLYFKCEICGKDVFKGSKWLEKNPFLLCRNHLMIKKYSSTTNSNRPEIAKKISEIKGGREKSSYGNTAILPTEINEGAREFNESQKIYFQKIYSPENLEKRKKLKQESIKKTCQKKYGGNAPCCSRDIQEKSEKILMQKYNVRFPALVPGFKEKREQSLIKNFGTNKSWVLKKSYYYENNHFDSSWELAFWIYHKDNNIPIKRNTRSFNLENGHKCYPDFLINNVELVEIKGDHLKKYDDWPFKLKCYQENNIRVIGSNEIEFYIEYVEKKYGEDYLKSFKKQKPQLIKTGV